MSLPCNTRIGERKKKVNNLDTQKEVRQTMPKVKLNRDAPLNEAAKRFYHFFRAGKSKSQICKLMGYSDATDCNRLKAPEFFTLRELRILYKEAQLPDEEFMKMIREEK